MTAARVGTQHKQTSKAAAIRIPAEMSVAHGSMKRVNFPHIGERHLYRIIKPVLNYKGTCGGK